MIDLKKVETSDKGGFDMDTWKKLHKGEPYTKKANFLEVNKQKVDITEWAKKYVITIQRKKYVTYAGLLNLAHKVGMVDLRTELVFHDSEKKECIFKATVVLSFGNAANSFKTLSFIGYGHTDAQNLTGFTKKFYVVMAETRAKARALRKNW